MTGGGTPPPRGEPLLLCSASPRRAELLRAAGIPFERGEDPAVDETPTAGSSLAEAVEGIAVRKARASAARAADRTVLCADTVVVLDGAILGKPSDREDAMRMLRGLSGRTHEVLTGVALARGGRIGSGVAAATVEFRGISDREIEAYVATGEPMDKAGGYAIQGGAAGFVTRLVGDRDTVVGLPIRLVRNLLERFGAGVRSADDNEGGAAPPS